MLSVFIKLSIIVATLVAPVKEKSFHPFYVSVTELQQNAAGNLEVSCKFFTDDFEQTLEKAFNKSLDISAQKDQKTFDQLIPQYINDHLSIYTDGKTAKLNYIGFEVEKESVYCYFEIEKSKPTKVEVVNSLLYDHLKEQMNIIHVTVNGKRQSQRLTYPQVKANFSF